MRTLFYTLLFCTLLSCEDNCDLSSYPSAPYNEPYHVDYGDNTVRYVYLCRDGYNNEVYTYYVSGGCWEYSLSYQYNSNCN